MVFIESVIRLMLCPRKTNVGAQHKSELVIVGTRTQIEQETIITNLAQ